MIPALDLVFVLAAGLTPVDTPTQPVPQPSGKVLAVISQWLKEYRKGEWVLRNDGRRRGQRASGRKPGERSLIERAGLLPRDYFGREVSYLKEIELLCGLAGEEETAEAARAILEVAAVGLDTRVIYTELMAPVAVRGVGEKHLEGFTDTEALAYLVEAANGKPGGSRRFAQGMQAAALRALGATKTIRYSVTISTQLSSVHPKVRLAAATGLGRLADLPSILPLVDRLTSEDHPSAIIEILDACEQILQSNARHERITAYMTAAATAAGQALGRSNVWAPDVAILSFLAKYRHKDSIPRLISFLERFAAEPKAVRSGRLSVRLQEQTNDLLVSLTGAQISSAQPEKWREFWNQEGEDLALAKAVPVPKERQGRVRGMTSTAFFNIPIQGSRILFVMDISTSMDEMMTASSGRTTAGGQSQRRKLEVAREELQKAIAGLTPDQSFNVICYAGQIKSWNDDLVRASQGNKRRLQRWVDSLNTLPSTNIYGALKAGLETKTLVYGERYGSDMDEIFFLSDGEPTSGEITNVDQIAQIILDANKFAKIRINTVYLEASRGGRGNEGSRLMRKLAEGSGGKFVQR